MLRNKIQMYFYTFSVYFEFFCCGGADFKRSFSRVRRELNFDSVDNGFCEDNGILSNEAVLPNAMKTLISGGHVSYSRTNDKMTHDAEDFNSLSSRIIGKDDEVLVLLLKKYH